MKKERVLTVQQQDFLNALLGEAKGDFKLALKIAGYSESTRPADIMKTLKDEIIDLARDALALNGIKASFEMADVMTNPSSAGASNKLKAAQEILNRIGVNTKTEDVNLKIPSGGLFILPAKEEKQNHDTETESE